MSFPPSFWAVFLHSSPSGCFWSTLLCHGHISFCLTFSTHSSKRWSHTGSQNGLQGMNSVFKEVLFKQLSFCRLLKPFLPDFEWTYSSVNIFGFETIYLVLFLPVAASPLFCFGYLYCYCFFYIIINNDILQRALQSVTRNCKIILD